MRFLREHAAELGIDPDKIICGGGSAGGHVAACSGVIEGHDGHHTIASWWLTLLHAAGRSQDGFGMKDNQVDADSQRGPLQELLA